MCVLYYVQKTIYIRCIHKSCIKQYEERIPITASALQSDERHPRRLQDVTIDNIVY